jgi:hypothetical protein
MQLNFRAGLQRGAETLTTFPCSPGKSFETTMLWGKEGDDAIGLAIIGVVENNSG